MQDFFQKPFRSPDIDKPFPARYNGCIRIVGTAPAKEVDGAVSELYWIALSYHLPSDSSRSRVYLWRKLRELGAENLHPGIAILPHTPDNLRRMRQLLQKIREMEGDGTLAELQFLEDSAEQKMVEQFAAKAQKGYARAIRRGMDLLQKRPDPRELSRLRKELEQAHRQDYFHTGLTRELRSGLEQLLHATGASVHEFAGAFRELLGESES